MLAVLSATGPVKTIRVPLTFLNDGAYQAMLVRDHSANDAAVTMEHTTARRADTWTVELRSGGGFVARFNRE